VVRARSTVVAAAGVATISAIGLSTSSARAGGLFLSERNARAGARAGAFVAGADDGAAFTYNPAGLVEAGTSIFLDATYVRGSLDYTRKAPLLARDPNTGAIVRGYEQTFATAHGKTPFVPIPTIVATFGITRDLVVAVGAYAPLGQLYTFPDTVKGKPAPQRYTVASLDGSALIVTGLSAAYRPIKQIQIGMGFNVMFGTVMTEATLGTCVPDRFVCAPEQPEFDARSKLTAGGILAPSANFGIQILPTDSVRFGASFDLPRNLKSDGKIQTRLPSSPLFDNAKQVGDQIGVSMKLPWVARVGVEVRPGKQTRIELAATYEAWSAHDRIEAKPKNIELQDIALFPPAYRLGDINIERKYQDSYSVKVGGEQRIPIGSMALDARLGVGYEKSAVPNAYVSALSMDANKAILALGAGFHPTKNLRIDASAVMYVSSAVDVSVDDAKLYRVAAVRANAPDSPDTPINAGKYVASTQAYSLGVRYAFQ
jgi:long-chain fatty acid transport protein